MALQLALIKKLALLRRLCELFVELSENPHDTACMDVHTEKLKALMEALDKADRPTSGVPIISASVGAGGVNHAADVRIVKEQLNVRMNVGFTEKNIELMGPISIGKIKEFQTHVFGPQEEHSGLIKPNDKTWKALVNGYSSSTPENPTDSEDKNNDKEHVRPSIIQQSVGQGGVNDAADVRIVKEQLNVRMNVGFTEKHIELMGPISIGKIREFQERVFGSEEEHSGLIAPNDKTWKALVSNKPLPPPQPIELDGDPAIPIGLDGDEVYLNQRDDLEVQAGITGDVTCSPNSLAMKLLTLADGDEELVKKEAIRIAKDSSLGPTIKLDESWGIAEMLVKLAPKFGPSETNPAHEVQYIMEALGEAFSIVESSKYRNKDYGWATLENFKSDVKTRLSNGEEISASTNLTGRLGHVVTIIAYLPDGILINDPFGARIDPSKASSEGYILNGENIGANSIKLIQDYRTYFGRRLYHHSALKTKVDQLLKRAEDGENVLFPPNLGEKNFYNWKEVEDYQIGFGKYGTASKGVDRDPS